jgi:hypothetical protein
MEARHAREVARPKVRSDRRKGARKRLAFALSLFRQSGKAETPVQLGKHRVRT